MKRRLPDLIVLAAMAAAAWRWGARQQLALEGHQLQWAQDLAFFHQIFFAASEGREWTSSLLLEPTGFFTMVHFHPIFAALVPIYSAAPGASTLLWFNVLAVVWAAWPLYRLGARASDDAWFGAAAGIAFLAWLPAEAAASADFRPMAFLIPGLAWVCLGVYARRFGALLLGCVICCGAREEASYILAACGAATLAVPWGILPGQERRGRWRWYAGGALLLAGACWFGVLLAIKENFFFHFDPKVFVEGILQGGGEQGPQVPAELQESRLRYLGQSWLGGWLLAPLGVGPLSLTAGPMLWLMTDTHREWHAMTGTYVYIRSAIVPLIAAAGVLGAAIPVRRWPKAAWVLGPAMLLGNALSFADEREAYQNRDAFLAEQAAQSEGLDALIARVSPEARAGTDYRLIAALSGRRVLWNVAHLYLDDGQPPWWTAEWPLGLSRLDTLLVPEDDPILARAAQEGGWAEAARGEGYVLMERTREPAGGYPEPLP